MILEYFLLKFNGFQKLELVATSWRRLIFFKSEIKPLRGQRQWIAIARVFLKNSAILILDEATFQLDSVTESLIQESLQELIQNKTTIIIAHRLSTLLHIDQILVFDKGNIIENGSHEELVTKNGLYKNLWDPQVGRFLGDVLFKIEK